MLRYDCGSVSKILIVDDNPQNLHVLEAMLTGAGHEVISARNGAEALAAAQKEPPDLVVSDVLMPVMDGYELCRRWKADERIRRIPFIIYTATFTDAKAEKFGLRLGADRYLIKPLPFEKLKSVVNEVVEEKRQGSPSFPAAPADGELETLLEYNEVIRRKLQSKVRQLEAAVAARQQAIEDLKLLTAELEERVRQRTADLREEGGKLARSNADLEMFASAASHDLAAPLGRICAFADMLEAGSAGKLGAPELELLARIRGNAANMARLVSDLLTLSRVSREPLPVEEVELNSVLSGVVSDLENVLAQSGGSIEGGPLPTVRGHAALWRSVFQNLLTNAMKFRAPDRRPRALVRSQSTPDGGAIISVEDNGIGFDSKFAQEIFQPFRRLHSSGAYEGSGIGLATCERIARRYGGEISAQSEPGRGSTFYVKLPPSALAVMSRK